MDEKAAKKSVGPILIGLAAILVIVGAVWFFFIRGKNEEPQVNNNNASQVEDKTKVTAADLSKVDETVNFGDYTAMFTLSKAIQNGQKIGEVVKVDGQVSHKTSSYSVVQINPKKDEEGEMSQIGTVFTIQDGESSDYPKDEERVEITAKVMEVSPLNFQLVTLKDFVKVVK
ncbi:MAG: hypothetical protein Q4A25_01760 [Candidatus Saccharibacteria bacterium]|nr:hypothetical protein [Candidatus Saccharibacteria bacterium]